jgi:hypothetical protein
LEVEMSDDALALSDARSAHELRVEILKAEGRVREDRAAYAAERDRGPQASRERLSDL